MISPSLMDFVTWFQTSKTHGVALHSAPLDFAVRTYNVAATVPSHLTLAKIWYDPLVAAPSPTMDQLISLCHSLIPRS